jgi:hypothetical protein
MDRKSSAQLRLSTSPFPINEQDADGEAQAREQRAPVFRVQPSARETDNRVLRTGLLAKAAGEQPSSIAAWEVPGK